MQLNAYYNYFPYKKKIIKLPLKSVNKTILKKWIYNNQLIFGATILLNRFYKI